MDFCSIIAAVASLLSLCASVAAWRCSKYAAQRAHLAAYHAQWAVQLTDKGVRLTADATNLVLRGLDIPTRIECDKWATPSFTPTDGEDRSPENGSADG
jgi:hypothetical protein